jgi:hypothetical protein
MGVCSRLSDGEVVRGGRSAVDDGGVGVWNH